MFKYKTTAELEAMDAAQLDAYKSDLQKHEADLRRQEIETAVDAIKTSLQSEIEKANKANVALEAQIKEIKDAQIEKTVVIETLKSVLDARKEDFARLKENRSGSVQIEVKAVGPMALTTNTTGQIPQAERESGITRIQRRQPFLLELVNTGTINSNVWEWVEQKNPEGGADMTAEGAKKSQADFDLVVASANVKKVTAFIKVTKEMLDDVDMMRAEIDQELTELINLKIDEQLMSGTGLTVNLTGIATNATAWAAGGFALTIPTPNRADVLRTAINQIQLLNFQPNYILLNPTDATAMDLDKGTDGHYLTRPFVNSFGMVVSGLPVVMNNGVVAGEFLVGDFTKSGVRFKEGLTINVGYENDDFTKNFVTILAEARLVQRVKSNHYGAFVKGNFAAAITALKKA